MRDRRRTFVLIAALTLCSTAAFAQSKPKPAPTKAPTPAPRATTKPVSSDPFVGVWRLSPEKSKFESGGPPKGFTRTYEDRGGGTIFMTTDVVGAQGTTRSYLVYKRDGKPYPEAAIGVDSIRLVMVKAVDRNTEELSFENAASITVSVSADGKTMTQVLSGKTSQGRAFTNTLIFDKQ